MAASHINKLPFTTNSVDNNEEEDKNTVVELKS
jgi:hypothetical protein